MRHHRYVPDGNDLRVIPHMREHLLHVGKSKLAGMMLLRCLELAGRDFSALEFRAASLRTNRPRIAYR
jgi:hypothetical protein